MATMFKHLNQSPLIHPELLEEVKNMHTKDPVLEKVFLAWKTSLEETYDSYFNGPVFKGFKNLNVKPRGRFGEDKDKDIPKYFIVDKDGKSSLCWSGGEIDCTIKDFEVSEESGGTFQMNMLKDILVLRD